LETFVIRGSAVVSSLSVGGDELRIIGHAINWRLNHAYEHTSPPELSEEDRQTLRILFNELCSQQRAFQFNGKPTLIEVRAPYACEDGAMRLSPAYFRLMTDAVGSVVQEYRQAPTEWQVVTGLPASDTSKLLSRMEAIG
jgi:hypothetical protein